MQHESKFFRFERNPSYASSVKTGLRFGLWLAPTTLLQAIGTPLYGASIALVMIVYSLSMMALRGLAWATFSLLLIVAGLAGFVVPKIVNKD